MRKVGQARSRELFISGRRIYAAEAERYGLLNFVSEENKLDDDVAKLTERLISSGPEAIKAAKNLVSDVPDQSREEFIEYTARMIAELRTSPEGREGTTAFLEKRKPNWAD
jgi:methylglutaconyl-CoA hydratase